MMTGRERVREALEHRPTDRLAIDFGGMRSTGIHVVPYDGLRRHLGLSGSGFRLYDVFQQLAEPEPALLERMGGDVVQAHRLHPAFGIRIDRWREDTLYGGIRCQVPEGYRPEPDGQGGQVIRKDGKPLARMPSGGYYFDLAEYPLADADSLDAVLSQPPEDVTEEELDFLEAEVRGLYDGTDKAILLPFGGNILEAGESVFGFGRFMELLLLEPDWVHAWARQLTAAYLRDLEKMLGRVGRYVQVIQFGDDLGSQQGPLISPETYREMIQPYHAAQYQYVRRHWPEVKVFLHSCGGIRPLIPYLVEAGVQVLNPVQVSAEGMDPVALKRDFGRDLVFWGGGADMQRTIPRLPAAEVPAHVRSLAEVLAKDSGFVFTQVHNIQPGVSPEAIVAIYDTALALG